MANSRGVIIGGKRLILQTDGECSILVLEEKETEEYLRVKKGMGQNAILLLDLEEGD